MVQIHRYLQAIFYMSIHFFHASHSWSVKLQNHEKQKQATVVDNFHLHISIISKLSAFM